MLLKTLSAIRITASAVVLLGSVCSADAMAEAIYQFIDQDGVTHYSNVPTDPRYVRMGRPLDEVRRSTRPVRDARAGKIIQKRTLTAMPMVAARPSVARERTSLHETILRTSLLHHLNPALVHAVIRAESAYNPRARSPKGAMGLMQLMPDTATTLNVKNPYDPEQNIAGGVRYLRYLLDRFEGNLELALAAYNAGENRVSRESGVPHISETQDYVRKVIRLFRDLAGENATGRLQASDSDALLVSRRFDR